MRKVLQFLRFLTIGEPLTVMFNPKNAGWPEIIAEVSTQGEISNIELKTADIEDIVRKVYI